MSTKLRSVNFAAMWEKFLYLSVKYPLDLVANIATLVPLLTGIFYYKRVPKYLKIISIFLLIIFIRDVIAIYYALLKMNNIFLYNFLSLFEIIFTGYIYYLVIEDKNLNKIILFFGIIILAIGISFWSTNEFAPMILTLTRLYQLILVIIYFNVLLNQLKIVNIIVHSMFWISSGFIIQATGTFFVSLFSGIALSTKISNELFNLYWGINLIMYILFCLFCTIAFYVSKYENSNTIPSDNKNRRSP